MGVIAGLVVVVGLGSWWWFGMRSSNAGADLDHDSRVSSADLSILLAHWNKTGDGVAGDVNGDHVVNMADLMAMLSSWGAKVKPSPTEVAEAPKTSTPSPTASATPKPGTTPSPSATPSPTPSATPKATSGNKSSTPTPAPTAAPTPTPTPPPSPTQCTNPLFTSSANFGSWSNGGYNVNNNKWNTGEAGPQTIYACAWNNWYIVSNQPGSGTDDSVKTYPDTQKLVNIQLSSMNNITSTFNVTTPSGGGAVTPNSKQWNAAYDLWLDNYNTEVMIWTNWTMNWQYWYGVYNGVSVTIGGVSYKAYYNGSDAMWFIRQNVTNSGSQDIAAVLRWAIQQGWLQNTQRINAIEYGFEVTYTGAPTTFSLNDYSLTTN